MITEMVRKLVNQALKVFSSKALNPYLLYICWSYFMDSSSTNSSIELPVSFFFTQLHSYSTFNRTLK
jgi:hypothetical protein